MEEQGKSKELQKVIDRFIEILPERYDEITKLVEELLSPACQSGEQNLAQLKQALHKMVGTSGSLQFNDLSIDARNFLEFCRSISLNEDSRLLKNDVAQIKQLYIQFNNSMSALINKR